jgi:hypothetical protein
MATSTDSLTTQAALDAEIALRLQGDARLSNYAGGILDTGIPDGNAPAYSAHGVLQVLVDGDNMTLGMWKLDSQKQRTLTMQDDSVAIATNPQFMNFRKGDDDGFEILVNGDGVDILLDALGLQWSGTSPDATVYQDIVSTGSQVDFDHNRFATGIQVTKTIIGHITAAWSVVSGVSLRGHRVKVGENP